MVSDLPILSRALEILGLSEETEILPDMRRALLPHQAIMLAWMLEKEREQ